MVKYSDRVSITFLAKLAYVICDLPAIASLLNITQYNGEYGCYKCLHPGKTVAVGKGHTRIYPPQNTEIEIRSSQHYSDYVQLAIATKSRVFGIKGPSVLSNNLQIPEQVVIDGLHMLYEGVIKMFVSALFDSKNNKKPFYLGRPTMLEKISKEMESIKFPKGFDCLRSLKYLSFWKAHDFKNFILPVAPQIFYKKIPSDFKLTFYFCH